MNAAAILNEKRFSHLASDDLTESFFLFGEHRIDLALLRALAALRGSISVLHLSVI